MINFVVLATMLLLMLQQQVDCFRPLQTRIIKNSFLPYSSSQLPAVSERTKPFLDTAMRNKISNKGGFLAPLIILMQQQVEFFRLRFTHFIGKVVSQLKATSELQRLAFVFGVGMIVGVGALGMRGKF
jgi:hypothetical protein